MIIIVIIITIIINIVKRVSVLSERLHVIFYSMWLNIEDRNYFSVTSNLKCTKIEKPQIFIFQWTWCPIRDMSLSFQQLLSLILLFNVLKKQTQRWIFHQTLHLDGKPLFLNVNLLKRQRSSFFHQRHQDLTRADVLTEIHTHTLRHSRWVSEAFSSFCRQFVLKVKKLWDEHFYLVIF